MDFAQKMRLPLTASLVFNAPEAEIRRSSSYSFRFSSSSHCRSSVITNYCYACYSFSLLLLVVVALVAGVVVAIAVVVAVLE